MEPKQRANPQSFMNRWKACSFNNLKIRTKITLFYLLLLVFSITVSNYLHQTIYSSVTARKVSDVSFQMLHLIDQNFNSTIDVVNGQSKVMIANSDIQQLLTDHQRVMNDPDFVRRLNTSLYSSMQSVHVYTGVYLFDMSGNQYSVDLIQLKTLNIRNIKQADWYPKVKELKGGYLLLLNGGGIFWQAADGNYMSLIRIVNDLETQTPIGVMVLNIPEQVFLDSFQEIGSKYNTDIAIFDEYDRQIAAFNKMKKVDFPAVLQKFQGRTDGSTVLKQNGLSFLVSYMQVDRCRWKIVSLMSFSELSNELKIFNIVGLIVLLVNTLLLFGGSLFISRLITTPVNRLLKSMKMVEKGRFEKVGSSGGNDEIGQLQKGYNLMVEEIRKLIDRVIEEQKIKRKAELDVLQAQIKPHFLYNTFDAISALALSGRTEDVYTVMTALGGYYRASLSKGNEVIAIAEEIEIVKNYLIIQQFRYDDLFTIIYDIDPEAIRFIILKLVLQPLVENAIYHGIKPKGEKGLIKIGVHRMEDHIVLEVEDDGVGMNDDHLKRINGETLPDKNFGFGLRGTIERLRIFYGADFGYQIETQKGVGTKIKMTVPCRE